MVTIQEPWYPFSFAEGVWWSDVSSFAGASGLVHFDKEGERNVDYSIYDLQFVGNNILFVPILHFESQTKSVRYQAMFSSTLTWIPFGFNTRLVLMKVLNFRPTSMFASVVWPKGKPPTDIPECGFNGEFCQWLTNGKTRALKLTGIKSLSHS